mgnify:CR=1 FL=1|tara:strand:- start:427 stop:753 length:327 start_codon:yes stop_codon:yes gene_type:complete
MPKQILKLGTHRNNRRIWLDKEDLLVGAGFKAGELYYDNYNFETQTIKLRLHDEGNRKVSKKTKAGRLVPIIDLNSTKVGYALGMGIKEIEVHYKKGLITIKPYEEMR